MEVGLTITTPTKLQFSRCSWLLTKRISKQNILGSHICIWRQRTHNHVWIASSENYRGFGPQPVKKKSDGKPPGEETDVVSKARQLLSRKKKESMDNKSVAEAPNVFPGLEVNKQLDTDADPIFDQRLDVIRRSALEKKEFEEKKKYQPIDYDAPVSNSEKSSLGLGAKIGIGVAIVAFALVFAIGDLLPSGSGEKQIEQKQLTAEDNAKFQAQLQRFEETLKSNPEDLEALEGAAVAHAELGEYSEAASLLEKLTQKSTKDPDAFRLLGDVRYALEDYDGSAVAYRNGIVDSSTGSLEILSGLTNALVAAKKPNENKPVRQPQHITLVRAVAWFDGASQQRGELCGAGGKLFLNDHLSISWMINCRPGSNTKAELIGAWTSLILAHRHTDNLLLLGDSKLIIDWLKGEADFHVAALNSWKERTKDATLLFSNLNFQHIFREANNEADTLSKKALHLTPNQIHYSFWVDGHKGNTYKINL